MNVVDSSGWLEYFADGPNAAFFAPAFEKIQELVVPTISIYEVFKRILQQRDEAAALQAAALRCFGRRMRTSRPSLASSTSQKQSRRLCGGRRSASGAFTGAKLRTDVMPDMQVHRDQVLDAYTAREARMGCAREDLVWFSTNASLIG